MAYFTPLAILKNGVSVFIELVRSIAEHLGAFPSQKEKEYLTEKAFSKYFLIRGRNLWLPRSRHEFCFARIRHERLKKSLS
ncbi:MAG: hypothetical protein H0X47_18790 [Nitrospirales bacterium]|nr:hypothetical protein [Nitrospirales bacterium]